jgi:hypothetical protein
LAAVVEQPQVQELVQLKAVNNKEVNNKEVVPPIVVQVQVH